MRAGLFVCLFFSLPLRLSVSAFVSTPWRFPIKFITAFTGKIWKVSGEYEDGYEGSRQSITSFHAVSKRVSHYWNSDAILVVK